MSGHEGSAPAGQNLEGVQPEADDRGGDGVLDITVCQPWFDHICAGRKAVEGRLDRGKFSELKPGSILRLQDSTGLRQGRTVAVVAKVVKYKSFEEYLSKEGLETCLPGIKTIEEGVEVYRQFYTAAEESSHGVLAIHIVRGGAVAP